MGREIRRVPTDWEHPQAKPTWQNRTPGFQPLFDKPFVQVAREWMDAAIAWDNGTDPDCAKHKVTHPFYWQWAGDPPDPNYYRPDWPEESCTHYQVYETVSEGTPVTPHFATKAELVEHLVTYGDDWDRARVEEGRQKTAGWDRKAAEDFVERAWAPSMVIANGVVFAPRDGGI